MKKFIIWISFTILATIVLLYLTNDNTSKSKSTALQATGENTKFERDWRKPNNGEEYTKISQIIVKNNISCPELLVKKAYGQSNYFICACRTDSEAWQTYQIWTASGDLLLFNDPAILKPTD